MMFVPHRKTMYGPPRPVTGIALLFYLHFISSCTWGEKLWKMGFNIALPSSKQTNFVALSPRANYTDWSTATCRRNLVPTFVDRGVSSGQRGGYPTVVNLSFLDRSQSTTYRIKIRTRDHIQKISHYYSRSEQPRFILGLALELHSKLSAGSPIDTASSIKLLGSIVTLHFRN
jgi:hypothetical protein